MDDPLLKEAFELQELLTNLTEENFVSSANTLLELSKVSENCTIDIARNILRLSVYYKDKIPVYIHLIQHIYDQVNIVHHIEQLLHFGKKIAADQIINLLIESKIIRGNKKSLARLNETEIAYIDIFKRDDKESLKEFIFNPTFDLNEQIYFRSESAYMSLIQYAALQGAYECFKFLLINDAKLKNERLKPNIIQCAISGGNAGIIELLEQSGYHLTTSDIEYAINIHKKEIFDWFLDQFPDEIPGNTFFKCVKNEFIYGMNKVAPVISQELFDNACKIGFTSLVAVLINQIKSKKLGFELSCKFGHVGVARLIALNEKIEVENHSHRSNPIFDFAIANNFGDIVQLFVENSIVSDIYLKQNKCLIINGACTYSSTNVVEYLLTQPFVNVNSVVFDF